MIDREELEKELYRAIPDADEDFVNFFSELMTAESPTHFFRIKTKKLLEDMLAQGVVLPRELEEEYNHIEQALYMQSQQPQDWQKWCAQDRKTFFETLTSQYRNQDSDEQQNP